MTAHVNVSSVWKELTGIHVNVSSTWKEVSEGWVNVSGVWKQFYTASLLTDPGNQSFSNVTFSADARNGLRIATDGDVDEIDTGPTYTDRGDWYAAGATSSDYEVFVTNSGDALAFGTLSTWLPLSSSQLWYLEVSPVATETCTLTVTIRHAVNTSDSISFTVDLSAFADTL